MCTLWVIQGVPCSFFFVLDGGDDSLCPTWAAFVLSKFFFGFARRLFFWFCAEAIYYNTRLSPGERRVFTKRTGYGSGRMRGDLLRELLEAMLFLVFTRYGDICSCFSCAIFVIYFGLCVGIGNWHWQRPIQRRGVSPMR